jgi:hypothetical protein
MIIKIDIYKKDNKYNFGGTNIFFMSKLSFLIHEILFVLTIKQVFFIRTKFIEYKATPIWKKKIGNFELKKKKNAYLFNQKLEFLTHLFFILMKIFKKIL